MRTERADITQMLNQMRAMREQVRSSNISPQGISNLTGDRVNGSSSVQSKDGFSSILKGALNSVNTIQQDANTLSRAYELGESGVDLTRVMIASQKASISFQATMQVRNKLVSAYQDIMNMPI